jgi:hypothetical protein
MDMNWGGGGWKEVCVATNAYKMKDNNSSYSEK